MKILPVSIRPLESLMLRDAGEFDPSARGVFSKASSHTWPRPSTIAGLISCLFLELKGGDILSINTWDRELWTIVNLLEKNGVKAIRGPYLRYEEEVYVPARIPKELAIVPMEQLVHCLLRNDAIRSIVKDGNIIESLLSDKDVLTGVTKFIYEQLRHNDLLIKRDVHGQERVGIALQARSPEAIKHVKRGYIYSVRPIAYPTSSKIFIDLILEDSNARELSEKLSEGIPVKFGGEHRIAAIEVKEEVESMLKAEDLDNARYALLLSPLLVKGQSEAHGIRYIGLMDVVGVGYSLARKRRKPLYPAILEGSIVRLPETRPLLENVLTKGLYAYLKREEVEYDMLSRIGYGSFIPLSW